LSIENFQEEWAMGIEEVLVTSVEMVDLKAMDLTDLG
jgi:hypothetical protein